MTDAIFVDAATVKPQEEFKKLILCFDGTGNTFSGTNADTNVAKILRKLDRNHPNQFHYYQTGIGTYDINEASVNKTVLGSISSSLSKTIDQGFGTTFDAHVIAGYRFLMRYYEADAKIYIFGFSRGAYTAKFLARMINKVGLLCKGNEEMVPFAYRLYQRSLQCESEDRVEAQDAKQKESGQKRKVYSTGYDNEDTTERACLINRATPNGIQAGGDQVGGGQLNGTQTNGTKSKPQTGSYTDALLAGDAVVKTSKKTEAARKEIKAFSQTFCRKAGTSETGEHENIKVFFLGMWDCVNSVAVIEKSAPAPVVVTGTAEHIRHAVAVDERRVKFKPALLAQDIINIAHKEEKCKHDDIREVWFPGNHGDIGGGWPAYHQKPVSEMTFWDRIWYYCTSRKPNESEELHDDYLQMSDMALEWMIREVDSVGRTNPQAAVHWDHRAIESFQDLMRGEFMEKQVLHGPMHDCLSFGFGTALFKVLMWKLMELLPLIPRWELNDTASDPKDKGWEFYRGLPNRGAPRDIPRGAILHSSLKKRLEDVSGYLPKNNFGDGKPCLRQNDGSPATMEEVTHHYYYLDGGDVIKNEWDSRHHVWRFKR